MKNPTYFHHWVAETIAELGGNSSQYLCGVEREWALTSAQTRMALCQGVFDIYFDGEFVESMRSPSIAITHLRTLH
jgi:hypothetical protein